MVVLVEKKCVFSKRKLKASMLNTSRQRKKIKRMWYEIFSRAVNINTPDRWHLRLLSILRPKVWEGLLFRKDPNMLLVTEGWKREPSKKSVAATSAKRKLLYCHNTKTRSSIPAAYWVVLGHTPILTHVTSVPANPLMCGPWGFHIKFTIIFQVKKELLWRLLLMQPQIHGIFSDSWYIFREEIGEKDT